MSVLIRGMKMPESCITCPLCECRNEFAYCEVGDKYLSWDWDERLRSSRNDHCPLTEVPPHGDLIDINALKLAILDVDYVNKHNYLKGVLNAINNAPTVIPADKEAEA